MKKFRKSILKCVSVIAAVVMAVCAVSCSSDSEGGGETLSISSITPSNQTIDATGSTTLTAKYEYSGSKNLQFNWSITSGSEYATVSGSGEKATVTGRNETSTQQTVTVKLEITAGNISRNKTCTIIVRGKTSEITLTSVSISGTTEIESGGTGGLTATPSFSSPDASADEVSYAWSITSGNGYAELSSTTGKQITITGKNTTSTQQTVTVNCVASYKGTEKNAATTITVAAVGQTVENELTDLKLASAASTIESDGTVLLTATASHTGNPSISFEWNITSGKEFASLSEPPARSTTTNERMLTGNNSSSEDGSVTVQVTATAGTVSKTATCTVTVKGNTSNPNPDDNVVLWRADKYSDGDIGTLTELGVMTAIADSSAGMKIESNTKTIGGDTFTKVLKTNGAGSISKRALKFTLADSAKIEVYCVSGNDTDAGRKLVLATGSTVKNDTNTAPTTAGILNYGTVDADTYYLYSGNSGINIYAVKITYSETSDAVLPTGITLDKPSYSFTMTDDVPNPTIELTATITNASEVTSGKDTITWSVSGSAVSLSATSGANVTVTAKSTGTATVTASTVNGITASCTVTVTSAMTKNVIRASDTPTGWAGTNWSSTASEVVTVNNRTDLMKYAGQGGYVIYVKGMIDMSNGCLPTEGGGSTAALDEFVLTNSSSAYSTYSEWKDAYAVACSLTSDDEKQDSTKNSSLYSTLWKLSDAYKKVIQLVVSSNTTIIGLDSSSGIKGGTISISGASNVVLRNLTIQDAYDPFPHHEVKSDNKTSDGYNAQWDCVTVQGTCSNLWFDHCTFKDTMELVHVMTGGTNDEKWQTYDGLLDIKGSGKYVTVSYCKFEDHDKTSLIGSDDNEGSSDTRQITYHHNYFLNCGQRLPMVRNTKLHLYNNLYSASSSPYYSQQYAVGVRKGSIIYAEGNYFDSGIKYSYRDSDGILYQPNDSDNSSSGKNTTSLASTNPFTPPYTYTASSASDARTDVESNAGAGVWTVQQ